MIYEAITATVAGLIGIFSPHRAAMYRAQRQALQMLSERGYDAARQGGPNRRWNPGTTTGDAELRVLTKLRDKSRELVRNNPFAAGAVNTIVNNLVGETGRDPQPMVMDLDGNLLEDVNKELLDLWWKWSEEAEITGLSIIDMQDLALRNQIQDGEVLIRRIIDKTRSGIPIRYEMIEGDQLDETYDTNDWYLGIRLDKQHRPLSYAIRTYHPGDLRAFGETKEIPATDIIHVFRRDRISQHRGCPWLTPIIYKLLDLDDYMSFEQLGAKVAASFGVFVTSDFAGVMGGGKAGKTALDEPVDWMEPGRIQRLRPGEKIEIASHNRPNSALPAFVSTILRAGGCGLSLGYESMANDYSTANYSSMRGSKIEERGNYRAVHGRQSRQMYIPIWRDFVKWAVWTGKAKRISAGEYRRDPDRFNAVNYPSPTWPWVDPEADVKAEILAIEAKIKSRSRYFKGQGQDPHDEFQTIAKDEKEMKDLGIAPPVQKPNAPNQPGNTSPGNPAATPEPDPKAPEKNSEDPNVQATN